MAASDNLDRYRIISTLGSGGMATVLLAEDELLGRQVALKRMSTEDVRGLSRLRREALLGASISHPNVVAVYDVLGTEDGGLVIVMEYVPGETLAGTLIREGRLAPAGAWRILDGVAAALDAIHQRGIVHRDVKPPNILLGAGGAVKLADLGIASVQDRTRITSAGTMLGSLRYMAPEQLHDAPATRAIDIYALSAVAFEALSGQKARTELNAMALAHAISTRPPPDLQDVWPAAPRPAAEALERGLALDPAERPASAGELVRQLKAAFEPKIRAPSVLSNDRRVTTPRPPRGQTSSPAARLIELELAQRPAARRPRGPGAAVGSRPHDRSPPRGGRAPIAAALLLLGAGAVALAVLLSANHPVRNSATLRAHPRGSTRRGASAGASSGASRITSAAGAKTPAGPVPSAAASPTSAVKTFYELAAEHRYPQAWALADPAFRSQLGGYGSFESGQSADRSITFSALRTISQSASAATVSLTTTSVRTDGTHHCGGTADLLPGVSGGWVVHQIQINCS